MWEIYRKYQRKMEMYGKNGIVSLDMGCISGTYQWDIYEKSMEYVGKYLGNLWKITYICIYIYIYIYMWDILPAFIGYVGNLWEIHGKSIGNL